MFCGWMVTKRFHKSKSIGAGLVLGMCSRLSAFGSVERNAVWRGVDDLIHREALGLDNENADIRNNH